MSSIKLRRLRKRVDGFDFTVGQCVPFYFCPRSVMLYLLHMGNHPEIDYTGGQRPILHLVADLRSVIEWAWRFSIPWVFSDGNAGSYYVTFHTDPEQLRLLNWNAIRCNDFRDQQVKECKQAEYLCYDRLPWNLIESVGVHNHEVAARVEEVLEAVEHRPRVEVRPDWYF